MPQSPSCPPLETWQTLLTGNLLPDDEDRYECHLASCPACREHLEEIAGPGDDLLRLARQMGDPTVAPVDPTLSQFLKQLHEAKALEPSPFAEPLDLYFLQSTDRADLLGTLGSYEVREVIGAGGMGIVLKAYDPRLQRQVAIKVMSPALAGSVTARRRFTREAKSAAAVCHDHIVAVHGVDEVDGLPYLVMQYIAGESLQARLERGGPLEVGEILRIGREIAMGLAAAHAQGLIHRDIKPANILLSVVSSPLSVAQSAEQRTTDNGQRTIVKMTDFGLARMVDEVHLTRSGVVAGTPEYMAPEQARGDVVDHRADLFSLGSVLYALCTGVPPFRGRSTVAVLRQVNDEEPAPVRSLNPSIPLWLEDLIRCLLAKDPKQRVQSAAELAALLEAGELGLNDTSPKRKQGDVSSLALRACVNSSHRGYNHLPSRTLPAHRNFGPRVSLAALVLLVALGLGAGFWFTREDDPAKKVQKGGKEEPADAEVSRKYPHDVYFDFRGKPLPPELMLTPAGSDRFVRSEPEGLRITLPRNRDDLSPVAVGTRFGIQGDFEITVALEILQAERPRDGFGVGASLFINKVDPPTEGATFGRLLRAGGKEVVFWDQGFGKSAEQMQYDIDFRPCTDKVLRLRLKREGDQLLYLLGTGLAGESFEELSPKTFGPKDIQQVLVRVTTGKQPCSVDVRLIDLRIRSGATPANPIAATATPVYLWLLAASVIALAITFVLGAALYARKRRGESGEAGDGSFLFTCPGCGRRLKATVKIAGKMVKCPECRTGVLFPSGETHA
jgi:serine/threonine protein kinase